MPHVVSDMSTLPQSPDVTIKQESLESTNYTNCVTCSSCGRTIEDRFFLRIGGALSLHMTCLNCYACLTDLSAQLTCYCKDSNFYCKHCYTRNFRHMCSGCNRPIDCSDWVRRAKSHVFHLACFACDNCKRQLSTGEEFAMLDNKVLCKLHYAVLVAGNAQTDSSKEDTGSVYGSERADSATHDKSKRIRTTFSEEQLHILQANFNIDSNPDGQTLERIAQQTGLSKRVTQVWFQNSRARQKKNKDHPCDVTTVSSSGDEESRNDVCCKCGSMYCLCEKEIARPTCMV